MSDHLFNIGAAMLLAWLAFAFYVSVRDESAILEAVDMRASVRVLVGDR